MRFKVDENLHPDVVDLLREEGHDVLSVWDQGLRGRIHGWQRHAAPKTGPC